MVIFFTRSQVLVLCTECGKKLGASKRNMLIFYYKKCYVSAASCRKTYIPGMAIESDSIGTFLVS